MSQSLLAQRGIMKILKVYLFFLCSFFIGKTFATDDPAMYLRFCAYEPAGSGTLRGVTYTITPQSAVPVANSRSVYGVWEDDPSANINVHTDQNSFSKTSRSIQVPMRSIQSSGFVCTEKRYFIHTKADNGAIFTFGISASGCAFDPPSSTMSTSCNRGSIAMHLIGSSIETQDSKIQETVLQPSGHTCTFSVVKNPCIFASKSSSADSSCPDGSYPPVTNKKEDSMPSSNDKLVTICVYIRPDQANVKCGSPDN